MALDELKQALLCHLPYTIRTNSRVKTDVDSSRRSTAVVDVAWCFDGASEAPAKETWQPTAMALAT